METVLNQKTLVIGASLKPERISNQAVHRLRNAGHPVVAIGGRAGTVADVSVADNLAQIEGPYHTLTLYLNAQRQKAYYDFILNSGAKRVIFNPGAENPELYEMLEAKGIEAENACTLVLLSLNAY